MAISNRDRVNGALDVLEAGLGPFVERELENTFRERTQAEALRFVGDETNYASSVHATGTPTPSSR